MKLECFCKTAAIGLNFKFMTDTMHSYKVVANSKIQTELTLPIRIQSLISVFTVQFMIVVNPNRQWI